MQERDRCSSNKAQCLQGACLRSSAEGATLTRFEPRLPALRALACHIWVWKPAKCAGFANVMGASWLDTTRAFTPSARC